MPTSTYTDDADSRVVSDQYPDDVGSRFLCLGRAHLQVFTKDVHVQERDGRPL